MVFLVLAGFSLFLGHRFLGAMEMTGSIIVWGIVASLLLQTGSEAMGTAAFLLLFYNGFDALMTRHMARKGLMLDTPQAVAAPAIPGLASHSV